MAEASRAMPARLARRASDRGPMREFLVFALGSELYGVELTRIKEILSPPPLTPVPRAAPEVVGVCSVRGLLVAVLDLRRKLRLVERPVTRRARILLTTADSGEVIGLLVDEVRQVVRLSENEIEIAAALGSDVSEHVLGVGRPDGAFLILLELSAIVTS
ncbi:MAG TPA: chemotaxis protein CheW [Polyangiaceae bacterium]|nr:chemotaxis protein CheW [Polyangiaceae bacterium]